MTGYIARWRAWSSDRLSLSLHSTQRGALAAAGSYNLVEQLEHAVAADTEWWRGTIAPDPCDTPGCEGLLLEVVEDDGPDLLCPWCCDEWEPR